MRTIMRSDSEGGHCAGAKTRRLRALISIAALALTMSLTAASERGEGIDDETSPLLVIYVGADDCAPCREWQQQSRTPFLHRMRHTRLDYREVKSPTLFDMLKDENWPEDLRRYREIVGTRAGVPLWLVVRRDRVVVEASGLRQWRSKAVPAIETLVRTATRS